MSDVPGALHRRVESVLGQRGERYTRSRRSMVSALALAGPLNIDELLDRVPALPRSSAYRNVRHFVDLGIISELAASRELARYELSEAVTGLHRHHARCQQCGSMTLAPANPAVEAVLERAGRELALLGFRVEQHHLEFCGFCRRCTANREDEVAIHRDLLGRGECVALAGPA